ncbi:orotate phosphoribosyltransferase [Paenibacillus hemerocallicola]|uniref:Orotate phosphoribosyltransferase n=1 Tax=Paenibacillus hemerocallicola TaxID=1172614 RepID=A0A5C4TCM5_9BACL|nr:orotate phosphoribosyltransferase [Paenibacillus hemerocallicola]TNJ66376.1 orotate phosphoribosyltransferase [Paenibacillus hemerocallicola]
MTLRYLDEQISEALLEIGAVSLRPRQPFTWTSGMKSPIYCDNRITISHPSVRDLIALGFAEMIREKYPDAEVLAGIATGGIPHAAFVAQKLNLPMIYVRDKAKGHGKENVIEGVVKPGQKVVMIEDLFSTGGSSVKAAQAVRDSGAEVLGIIAIFSYQLDKASKNFNEAGFAFDSLSNYSALIDVSVKLGKIPAEDVDLLQSWRTNPDGYGV